MQTFIWSLILLLFIVNLLIIIKKEILMYKFSGSLIPADSSKCCFLDIAKGLDSRSSNISCRNLFARNAFLKNQKICPNDCSYKRIFANGFSQFEMVTLSNYKKMFVVNMFQPFISIITILYSFYKLWESIK
jgi:hypothetical protein